jgi:hypothetical protein
MHRDPGEDSPDRLLVGHLLAIPLRDRPSRTRDRLVFPLQEARTSRS